MQPWRMPAGLGTFCALTLGIALAPQVAFPIALSGGGLGLAATGVAGRTRRRAVKATASLAAVVLLGGAAGALRGVVPKSTPLAWTPDVEVAGRVIAWDVTDRGVSVRLEAHRIGAARLNPPALVRFYGESEWGSLPRSEWLRLRGDLVPDRSGTNPGAWAWGSGGARLLPARGTQPVWGPAGTGLVGLRESLAQRASRLLPGFPGRYATGVLLGRGSALTPDERSVFRRTGASHLISVSGLHVGLVVSLVMLALGGLSRGMRATGALAAAWGYAGLAGWAAPAVRSVAMISFWCAGGLLRRPRAGIAWFALALPWILWSAPEYLHSASFRLSAGAVAGLIFAMEIAPRCAGRGGTLLTSVVVSLGAQWGTLPTSLQVFGTLSPLATLPNLLAIPLTALFLPAAFLALAVEPVPALGQVFRHAALALGIAVERTLTWSAGRMPYEAGLAVPPIWALAGFPLLLLVWFTAPAAKRRSPHWRAAACALAVVCVVLALWPLGPARGPWAAFLDVGQGDAAVLRLSDGTVWLVDVGDDRGPGDAAANAILPFLRHARVRSVDGLILTHRHRDHTGALGPFLDGVPVREVYDAGYGSGPTAAAVDSILGAHRRWACLVAAGDTLHAAPGVLVTALHPRRGDPTMDPPGGNLNEASLVIRVEDGDWSALLAGDAEGLAEASCLEYSASLRARLLKVGHHGSRTSTSPEFLRAVSPEWAVISVGTGNHFGHPDPATVARIEQAGASVFRTDRDGAVFFRRRRGASWEIAVHPPD